MSPSSRRHTGRCHRSYLPTRLARLPRLSNPRIDSITQILHRLPDALGKFAELAVGKLAVTIRSKRPVGLNLDGIEALCTMVLVRRRSRSVNDAKVISGVFGVIITGLPTRAIFFPFKRVTSAFSQTMSASSFTVNCGTNLRAKVSNVAPLPRMDNTVACHRAAESACHCATG